MMLFHLLLLEIPIWTPGNPGYAAVLAISSGIAIIVLGICAATALKNPGFMRKKKT